MMPGPVPELVGDVGRSGGSKDGDPPGSPQRGAMPIYFTDSGPDRGPYFSRDADRAVAAIGVSASPMSLGEARSAGVDSAGAETWRLSVRGVELPGLWIIVGREFRPAR